MAVRNATKEMPRDLRDQQPEFGHDGATADADERPQSVDEIKPGLTPGKPADSHLKLHKTDERSKST